MHPLDRVAPAPRGLDISDFPPDFRPRTTLDLDLSISVAGHEAHCSFTYREDVCDRAEVEELAADPEELLAAAGSDPGRPLSALRRCHSGAAT